MREFLWIVGIAVLFAGSGDSVRAEEAGTIEGRWKVVSVELAGAPLSGFEEAGIVFEDGIKTFTLPDGKVEKGAYRLDANKRPSEIDSTTEGKGGIEAGIYSIDGDTLKLCLTTGGGPRPKEFVTAKGGDHLLIVLRRVGAKPADNRPAPPPLTGKRPFRMGFTGFVYDYTPEAVAASRAFVRENGDILAHHIEGVPWAEVLNGDPFPKALLDSWEGKKSATPPKGKVYLAISPGRGDLKVADKAGPLPDALKGKTYDDPLVIKTYLSYCRQAIAFFKPDYLAIGIETNEIHSLGAKPWQAYAALHAHVYAELKKDHPDLPVFASWTLHNMFKNRGAMLEDWVKLMPHNDLVAVSYYPFFSFVHQDYDSLWDRIKDSSPELFVAWKDCGLLDEAGKARPAYRVWKDYFDLPLGK